MNQAIAAIPDSGNVEIGGGICSVFGGPIEVAGNSAVSGNRFAAVSASNLPDAGIGGGVYLTIGPITIDSSTNNSATGDGGGVWNGLSLAINNSTVTGNQSGGVGGGIFNRGTFTSANSTISGNTPDDVFPNT